MEKQQSVCFNRLKVVLMFFVCFMHTSNPHAVLGYEMHNELVNNMLGGVISVNHIILRVCVPFFS